MIIIKINILTTSKTLKKQKLEKLFQSKSISLLSINFKYVLVFNLNINVNKF